MSLIFNNPTDNMNKRKFKIFITGLYEPKLPDYFTKNDIPPFYDEVDAYAISFVPPSTIVDICYQDREFTIPDIDDIVIILDIINSYLEEANALPHIPTELNQYLNKCKKTTKLLTESYERYLHFLKNKYPNQYATKKDVFDLFKKLNSFRWEES